MIKQFLLAELLGKHLSELNSHYPAKMISFTWAPRKGNPYQGKYQIHGKLSMLVVLFSNKVSSIESRNDQKATLVQGTAKPLAMIV